MELLDKLSKIQRELKAPKNQFNGFGKYSYRSCEDILEAVKPLLDGTVLTISDEIVNVGDRYYIKATARITDGKEEVTAYGIAREAVDRKGMDDSQITGATSSYARKYALNGLFLIDDNKDSDSTNKGEEKKSTNAINLLKIELKRLGAKDEKEALDMIDNTSGVRLDKMSDLTNDQAKLILEDF